MKLFLNLAIYVVFLVMAASFFTSVQMVCYLSVYGGADWLHKIIVVSVAVMAVEPALCFIAFYLERKI